jgi:hypothetical protein
VVDRDIRETGGVLLDKRQRADAERLAQLCERHTGLGAVDGVGVSQVVPADMRDASRRRCPNRPDLTTITSLSTPLHSSLPILTPSHSFPRWLTGLVGPLECLSFPAEEPGRDRDLLWVQGQPNPDGHFVSADGGPLLYLAW